jgi:hypothetical protein
MENTNQIQRIRAVASFGDDPSKVEVVLPIGDVRQMLSEVSTKPQFQVYGMSMRYSYPEEVLATLPPMPANTLVEVALPFCFHLPNGITLRVSHAGPPATIVALTKVWTSAATGSSTADYYATDRVTYHNSTTLRTPDFPQDPALGPIAQCSGVNVERERDATGMYRYTRARIFFDTTYPATIKEKDKEFSAAEKEVVMIALQVVNRLIDVYRLVTYSDYIQRLPAIHVTDLFFRQHNMGSHGASFGHGLRTAIMNRSEREMQEIAKLLRLGDELTLHEFLLLDAQASLEDNRFALAVIHAFQALELYLEEFLRARLVAKGLGEAVVEAKLKSVWRTKERLTDLLQEATGHNLLEERRLWDDFCTVYDQIRNKLIHSAHDLDTTRTRKTVQVCRDVIRWVETL